MSVELDFDLEYGMWEATDDEHPGLVGRARDPKEAICDLQEQIFMDTDELYSERGL